MLRRHWGFRKNSVKNTPWGEENPSWLIAYLFKAPVRGNPLEFGDEIWRQKTRVLGLPDGEDTMPARDRRTDGQTDRHVAIAITRASIASRGYKVSLEVKFCLNTFRYSYFL